MSQPVTSGRVTLFDSTTPQAQRVERAVHVDGRVVQELRPVGLEIWETVRVSLPEDRLVSRLGQASGVSRGVSRARASRCLNRGS
jgi:hypothetical protein